MSKKSVLSIFSLNCELDKNYERIYAFLERNRFDVYCFQELPEDQIQKMSDMLGATRYVFSRNIKGTALNANLWWGNGLFIADSSSIEHSAPRSKYYRKNTLQPHLSMHDAVSVASAKVFWRSYEYVDVVLNGRTVRIGTTHFTWGPVHDQDNRYQKTDAPKINQYMTQSEHAITCGDFNISKGHPLYPTLARNLQNLLPSTVTHTLDPELFRDKNLNYDVAVDTFFKKGDIKSSNFALHEGLSDHQGVSIEVQ